MFLFFFICSRPLTTKPRGGGLDAFVDCPLKKVFFAASLQSTYYTFYLPSLLYVNPHLSPHSFPSYPILLTPAYFSFSCMFTLPSPSYFLTFHNIFYLLSYFAFRPLLLIFLISPFPLFSVPYLSFLLLLSFPLFIIISPSLLFSFRACSSQVC